MATKKQILESNELLQQKRKAYHLSDEGFEEYKKFLSDLSFLVIKHSTQNAVIVYTIVDLPSVGFLPFWVKTL